MDIKIKNVSPEVMRIALDQARRGRLHILDIMDRAIEAPRTELSRYAPRIVSFNVDPEKIGTLIGPGGKTIKSISEKHDVTINIENDGSVTVYCKDADAAEAAKASLLKLLEEPEVGKTYDAVVRRIVDFGAFVEYLPGREGLVHISKMAPYRVEKVTDILQMNQEVPVRIIEIDKMGRVNLSLIYDEKEGGDRGGRGDGEGRGDRSHGGRGDRGRGDRGGRGGRDSHGQRGEDRGDRSRGSHD
jgi:polyribonucleotide nucleotidyltransferase